MLSAKTKLTTKDYGRKGVILGKSGSGKSYSARVYIEEGRELGVSIIVVDPQDAYGNLEKLGFDYLHAKGVKSAEGLGALLARSGKSVVIRTKGMTIEEQQEFLRKFLRGFRTNIGRGIRTIIIDEAHKFAPEGEKAASKGEIRSMFQENRSDGLGAVAVEQRSQRLDKTVLSQADFGIFHQMTAFRDLKAIEPYLDNPEQDLPRIKKLHTGQALLVGFSEDPKIEQIRRANTKHTGEAPTSLITEDEKSYSKNLNKVHRGGKHMENVAKNDAVSGVVPSLTGFMDLVAAGAKMSVGLGLAGIVGAVASRWQSPIPFVSTRTLASGMTTIVLYAGYRHVKQDTLKSVLGYAAAGAAVHTAGSLIFDVLAATKLRTPGFVNFALATMTGVSPVAVEGMAAPTSGQESGGADLNTRFA